MTNRVARKQPTKARYDLGGLDDNTLVRRLEQLLCDEHEREADLLAHIGEVDERKLFARFAYSSMFRYCVGELHLSESAAYKRIHAARAARKIPALLEMIARGDLHLTGFVLLAPHLCEDNYRELCDAARHKSKSEVEVLLAERYPKPDAPAIIRKLPAPRAAQQPSLPGEPSLTGAPGAC